MISSQFLRRTACIAVTLQPLTPLYVFAQQESTFDSGVAEIAETFTPALAGKTVAVFEFPDLEGRVSNLSRMVSEQLTTELVQRLGGQGTVVERRQVIQVMAELNLQKTELTAAEVARVGRQLGADAIVLGSTTVLGNAIIVNARVVAVTGGRVLAAGRMNVQGSPEMIALASAGLDAPTLTPRAQSVARSAPPSPLSRSEPTAPPAQRSTLGTVTILLNRCTQSADTIRCDLTLTADTDERFSLIDETYLYPSRMIDAQGGAHPLRKASIGGRGKGSDLVSGVPMAATLEFEEVPATNEIPLIEVFAYYRQQARSFRFRNVPVR